MLLGIELVEVEVVCERRRGEGDESPKGSEIGGLSARADGTQLQRRPRKEHLKVPSPLSAQKRWKRPSGSSAGADKDLPLHAQPLWCFSASQRKVSMGIPGTRRGNGQVTWWTGQGMAAGVERYFRRAYLTVPYLPSLSPSLLLWA